MSEPATYTPPVPLPSSSPHSIGSSRRHVIVADERVIVGLINKLIYSSGLSQGEVARRLGVTTQSLSQYRRRARRPSVQWLVRLAEVCGGHVTVELRGRE